MPNDPIELDPLPETPETSAPVELDPLPEGSGFSALSNNGGLLDTLGWVGDKIHQGANAVGEGVLSAAKSLPAHFPGSIQTPGDELMARTVMSPLLGQKFAEGMSPQQNLQATNELSDAFGEHAAPYVLGGANIVAQAPTMLMGLGWAQKGTRAAQALHLEGKVLPKLAQLAAEAVGSGAEGAAMSAGQAVVAGESPVEAAEVGGLFGAGAHALGAVAGHAAEELLSSPAGSRAYKFGKLLTEDLTAAAKDGSRRIGAVVGNALDRMADELGFTAPVTPKESNAFLRPTAAERVQTGVKAEAQAVQAIELDPLGVGTKVRPGELEPSIIMLHLDENGGVLATINELNSKGERKFYDVKVSTPDEAARLGALAENKKIAIASSPQARRVVSDMAPEMMERLYRRNNRPLMASDSSLKGTKPEMLIRRAEGFPDLERPPRIETPDSAIILGKDGHIKLSPIPDQVVDVTTMPERGESVMILGRGGQRTPGTYHGVDPVTGKAVVDMKPGQDSMGAIVQVSPYQVVKADPSVKLDTPITPPEGVLKVNAPSTPPKGGWGYIQNPDGGYLNVQVVSKGSKPGNVLVTLGPTSHPMEIEASKVESRLPPGVENFEDLVPLPVDPAPPLDVNTLEGVDREEVDGAKRVFDHITSKSPGAVDSLLNKLVGGQARLGKVMAFMHLRNQGSLQLQKSEAQILGAVERLLPKGPARQKFNRELTSVFLGKTSWEDFAGKNPGASEALKTLTSNLMGERTALDGRIAELGGIPDKLVMERAQGLIDPYLARMYMTHLLPAGEWAKHVRNTDAFDKAVQYLIKDMKETGLHVLPEQVSAALETLLKAPNIVDAAKSSGLKDSKAVKKLIARQEIPPELRAVMGELEAGSVRMAASIGGQRAIVAKLEMFQDIAADQNLSSIGRRPDLYPEPVPDIPRLYGKLSGRYVKPEIYSELIALPNQVRNMYTFANKVSGWMKGNQLAGFGPWWTSMSGNLQGGVFSGGLSLMRPDQYGRGIFNAVKAIHDFHADPTGRTGDGWLLKEAKKAGADWAGRGEVEISSTSKKFVRDLMKTLEAQPHGGWSAIDAIKKGFDTYNRPAEGFGNLLDLQDQIFRLAAYSNLRRANIAKGMPDSQAALEAAHKIALSFPNPGNVGPAVQGLRNQVGVAAPYLTPKMEDMRIYSTLLPRLMKEPDLKWRLLGHAALFGGIGQMMKHMSGTRDEDLKLANLSLTKRQQSVRPLTAPLPFRDDKGRIQFLDASNWFLPGQLMQGHPDDSWFNKVAYNLATSPLEGGLLQNATDTLAETAGLKRPFEDHKLLEGEAQPLKGLELLARGGFAPRFGFTAADTSRKLGLTGTLGRNEEQLTGGQAAAKAIGLNVIPVGEKATKGAKAEISGDQFNLIGQLKSALMSRRTPEQKAEIKAAIKNRLQLLRSQKSDIRGAQEAAQLQELLNTP